jgi:putative transcriptional regulator
MVEGPGDVNFIPTSNGGSAAAEQLLASYASGGLSRPMHVLVASHLSLSARNRRYVAALESVAAEAMEHEPMLAPVAERGRRLAAIFGDDGGSEAPPPPEGLLPAPLRRYIGMPFDSVRWRNVLPGLREARIEDADGLEASLLWIRAGRAMPSHTHAGVEATLVLQGSFSDIHGEYARGDMAVADDDVDHKPVAGSGEDCICFAVSEGPVRLTGPVARLFGKILGH